jgi:hypothetical protein
LNQASAGVTSRTTENTTNVGKNSDTVPKKAVNEGYSGYHFEFAQVEHESVADKHQRNKPQKTKNRALGPVFCKD